MMYYQVILFTVLYSFLLNYGEMKTGVRNKRILYGHEATSERRDAYPIFRYYVYLAKAPPGEIDEEPSMINSVWSYLQKVFLPRGANLEYLHCGASLLTPNIIQTACHCLADFERSSDDDNYTYAWPLNVWEDRIYSYIGSNEVSKMYDVLIPKHYVIYQDCRMLEHGLNIPMMDFGFIVTKDRADKKAPTAAISYAPVYRAKDILKFYYSTVNKEFTCLVIGHGDWQLNVHTGPEGFSTDIVSLPSEPQRWGWRTVLNYVDCLSASYSPKKRKKQSNRPFVFFNYTRDSTLVCLKAFTDLNFEYNLGQGDSGGPVACNDVLFAVNCMSEDFGENRLSYATPIVHTMFTNAAEYRDGFIEFCQSWGPNNELSPDIPYQIPTYPDLSPTPPPIDIHPLSQCSLVTIGHYLLLVMSSTVLFTFPR